MGLVGYGSGLRIQTFFIRIRIQGNYTDSTDPDSDPPHWLTLYILWDISQRFLEVCELTIGDSRCLMFINVDATLDAAKLTLIHVSSNSKGLWVIMKVRG